MSNKQENIYRIELAADQPALYALKYGNEILGTLAFDATHGSRARANIGGRSLLLKRKKVFKKDIHIHEHEDRLPVARFSATALRGTLSFGSTTYAWIPTNALLTSWAWQDPAGNELLRVSQKLNFFETQGEVCAERPLTAHIEKLLALLGWHLVLLGHQDPGAHLISSLEVYLGNQRSHTLKS